MSPISLDELTAEIATIEAATDYRRPAAYGVGLATWTTGEEPRQLDAWYPVVNRDEAPSMAALLSRAVGRRGGSGTWELDGDALAGLAEAAALLASDGKRHPTADAVRALAGGAGSAPVLPVRRAPVVTFVADLDEPPADTADVYLRLHLLSHRKVRPHGVNLDGIFGLLPNVVWTNHGPAAVDGFEQVRLGLRAAGVTVQVTGVDKFPRMTDYVVPDGVRIADADRVRLGAHLAEGTTVMHEGFVNYNAGTLGPAMVEGRISAGVVVGAHSDIGGGASIMGTLSGGGKEVVSIGEHCLLGANGGIGISLGDGSIVEAGLYVTSGTLVTLPDGEVVKARDLSGVSGMLFRRNSSTGAVEALPTSGSWTGLNDQLHAHN